MTILDITTKPKKQIPDRDTHQNAETNPNVKCHECEHEEKADAVLKKMKPCLN